MLYQLFTDLSNELISISNMFIKDTECKHIAINTPEKTAKIFQDKAVSVNYEFCFMSLKNNFDVINNKEYVRCMAKMPNFRPAKYIIDKNGRIWADNTHTSLSIMVRNGIGASIKSADYFFIDLRDQCVISQPPHLPILSHAVYTQIIFNALKLQKRLDDGWRPLSLSYPLEDLYLYDNYGV